MLRLRKIELLLPVEANRESRFHDELIIFLSGIPSSSKRKRSVTFSPQFPNRSWPITSIGCSSSAKVQLNFLHKSDTAIELRDAPIRRVLRKIERKPIAEPVEHTIEIAQLNDILLNKLVTLDHIGLNIPSTLVSKVEYRNIITSLGNTCTLHHYPTGQDWDFILPSTRSEWEHGISDFRPGREPRGEFVYDEYTQIPIIQLCIETKLTKKRLCKLLPDPLGISYEGLPFRTVFIRTPWRNFGIRCDMSAYSRNRQNSWITGQWLATRGNRIGDFD